MPSPTSTTRAQRRWARSSRRRRNSTSSSPWRGRWVVHPRTSPAAGWPTGSGVTGSSRRWMKRSTRCGPPRERAPNPVQARTRARKTRARAPETATRSEVVLARCEAHRLATLVPGSNCDTLRATRSIGPPSEARPRRDPERTWSWAPMSGRDFRVAWYRFRATFGRHRRDYIAIIVLVGLVGGLAMGALVAARRTQSSFATFLANTNPSNLSVTLIGGQQNGGGDVNYSPAAAKTIEDLPGVKHLEVATILTAAPLQPDGSPRLDTDTLEETFALASIDGLFFNQDLLAVTQGRMANPN